MQIGNVKSHLDLQAKKNLQKEILALEVSNEQENQRRRKEAGIATYEPAKVLSQYKTSAEIQADRASAEQDARKTFDELGFGYQEASQLVAWLSSSFINRLNDFNANAKGIKTEITKNFSPTAYKNVQFIQNFLERYFDELDVNYGKKFGVKDSATSGLTTLNQISEFLPKTQTINNIITILNINLPPSPDKDLLIAKLSALKTSSLTPEMISNLNASLTQGERSTLTRKLLSVIRRSQFVSQKELKEIEDQFNSRDDRIKPAVVNKLVKLVSQVDSKKPFVNVVEFVKQYLDSIGIQDRQSFQDSNLDELLNTSIQAVARDLERVEEIKRIKIFEETEPFDIETTDAEFYTPESTKIPDLDTAIEVIDLDSIRFFTEQEIEALKKIRPILKNKDEAKKRREIRKTLDRMITTVEVINDSDKWVDEFKEDITNDRSKGASVEENKEQIIEFLATDPSAPAIVDKLIPALEEEQTAFASEVVKEKTPVDIQEILYYIESRKSINVSRDTLEKEVKSLLKNIYNRRGITELSYIAKEDFNEELASALGLEEIGEFIEGRPTAKDAIINAILAGRKKEKESFGVAEEESFGVVEEAPSEEQANRRAKLNRFFEELKNKTNAEERIKILRQTAKSLGIASKDYSGLGQGKLKEIITEEYLKLSPLDLVGRKEVKPEGFTVGLGLRRQRINQKLARHFKEDEQLLKKVVKKLKEESSSDEETEKLLKGHSRRTAKADKIIEKKIGKGWFSNAVVQHLHDEQAKKEDQERKTFGFSPVGDTIGRIGKGPAFRKSREVQKGGEVEKGGLGREPSVPSFNAKRIPVKKVGKGIEPPQENPTYREFGKYRIHVPQLLNNNTANFKYPSLGSIPSIKPVTVSQDYKEFLIDLLNTGKFSERELKRLPQREIKHFERVVIGAGLVEKFGLKVGSNDEDKQDAERFELLKGEYLAGNNNEKLLKELRALVVKFINNGRLIKSEGHNLLLQLSAF